MGADTEGTSKDGPDLSVPQLSPPDRTDPGSLSSTAARNATSAVVARIALMAFGMILTPFVLGRLQARAYGLLVTVGSIYDYISLLRGGINGALRRFVTYYHHAGNHEEAQSYYSTGFWWAALLRVSVLLIGLSLAWPITGFFRVESAERLDAAFAIGGIFLAAVITDQNILFQIPIFATGRTARISMLQLAGGFVRMALIMAALSYIGTALKVYSGALITGELIAATAMCLMAAHAGTVKHVIPAFHWGKPGIRRALFRYGGLATLSQLAGLLYLATDNLIIGRIYGPEAVTHYSLGARWAPLVLSFLAATMSGLIPLFTSLEARGEEHRSRGALLRLLRVTASISVPVCLAPCVVGDIFLSRWVGPEYRDSYRYLIAMLAPTAVEGSMAPLWMALTAEGRVGWVATGDIVVAVANPIISLVLAFPLHLGLLGFALGNTIALVSKNLILVIMASRRDPTMPSIGAMLRSFPLAVFGAVPGLALLWLARPYVGGSLAVVILSGVAGGAVALCGSLLVTLGPGGIRQVLKAFSGAWTGLSRKSG